MVHSSRSIRLLPLAALAALLTACASSRGSGSNSPAASGEAAGAGGGGAAAVTVSSGHLVAPDGHSLYMLSTDSVSHLACTGGCRAEWPPLLGKGSAGSGVDASGLSAVQRGEGSQVAYKGHPLYEFSGDMSAGDANGSGIMDFGGTWSLVSATGAAAQPASGGGGGGGGYGDP
jgi:predicted lipoprotein with Yx(FWY)xxD motif